MTKLKLNQNELTFKNQDMETITKKIKNKKKDKLDNGKIFLKRTIDQESEDVKTLKLAKAQNRKVVKLPTGFSHIWEAEKQAIKNRTNKINL